jgi:hypothetical protein
MWKEEDARIGKDKDFHILDADELKAREPETRYRFWCLRSTIID